MEIEFKGDPNPKTGMLEDFHHLNRKMQQILDLWDHKTILEEGDPLVPILLEQGLPVVVLSGSPTVEMMAMSLFLQIRDYMSKQPVVGQIFVESVRLFEDGSSFANFGLRDAIQLKGNANGDDEQTNSY